MIPISTEQRAVLATRAGYGAQVAVWVEDSAGVMVCLNDYAGQNWVESVSWSDSIDAIVMGAEVRLKREVYELSAAPGVMGSRLNASGKLLAPNRRVTIQARVVPLGTAPAIPDSADGADGWALVFDGFVDAVDWGSPEVVLECRDKGARLQDRFIEHEIAYSNESTGELITSVLQAIINDNFTAGVEEVPTLYTPNGTAEAPINADDWPPDEPWVLRRVVGGSLGPLKKSDSLLGTLNDLAAQIGWVVRYRWHVPTSAWQLVFFRPERTPGEPQFSFAPWACRDVTQMRVSREGVRNKIIVFYESWEPADRAPDGSPTTQWVYRYDPDSQAKYGTRTFQVTAEATKDIHYESEAIALADIVLSDLKDPRAEASVAAYFFPFAASGDYYELQPDGIRSDSAQWLAVVDVRHSVSATDATTDLTIRGQPAGMWMGWLGRGAGAGVGPSARETVPATPTLAMAGAKYDAVQFTVGNMERGATVEIHKSLTAVFEPSASTLVGEVAGTEFSLHALAAGVYAYVRVVQRVRGLRSLPSNTVEVAGAPVAGLDLAEDQRLAFKLQREAGLSLGEGTDPITVTWDLAAWDSAGGLSSGAYEVQAAGLYRLDGQVWIPDAHAASGHLRLYVNGTERARGPVGTSALAAAADSEQTLCLTVGATLDLAVHDVITMVVIPGAGLAGATIDAAHSWLEGRRLPG